MSAIPTGQVDRLLPSEPASLTLTPQSSAGTLYDLASPATFEIFDGDGASVFDELASVSDGGHSLSVEIPVGALEDLDDYDVVWTAALGGATASWSSRLEICGGRIASVDALRGSLDEFASIDLSRLLSALRIAEQTCEKECQVAFVPRAARATVRGSGRSTLILPHVELREVLSIGRRATPDAAPVALTSTEIAAIDKQTNGLLVLSNDVWTAGQLYDVHYTHGYDAPPADIADAVRQLAVEIAKPSSADDPRAMSLSNEFGTFRLATAGRDGATGIPTVDAAFDRNRREPPAVG